MVAGVATQTVVVVGMMPVVVVMDMLKVSVIVEEVVAAVLEWTAVAGIVLAVLVGVPGVTLWNDVAEVVAVSEVEARLMPATVVVTVGPLPGPCESRPSFPADHSPK
jgi:hypothetical protein